MTLMIFLDHIGQWSDFVVSFIERVTLVWLLKYLYECFDYYNISCVFSWLFDNHEKNNCSCNNNQTNSFDLWTRYVRGLMSYLGYLCLFVYSGDICCACLRLVVCGPNVGSFSGFSILDCPFGILSRLFDSIYKSFIKLFIPYLSI